MAFIWGEPGADMALLGRGAQGRYDRFRSHPYREESAQSGRDPERALPKRQSRKEERSLKKMRGIDRSTDEKLEPGRRAQGRRTVDGGTCHHTRDGWTW